MRQPNEKTSTRFTFYGSVTPVEIADILRDPDLHTVQTSVPAEPATWDLLNRELFSVRPDIQLRVFGFYSQVCDLSFLQQMDNVRDFAADCLMDATGVENIARLTNLERLSLGIYQLASFDILERLPAEQIVSLDLGETSSKRLTLRPLDRFTNLKALSIDGHRKEIEVIGGLSRLEDVTLRSIGSVDLSFLQNLEQLWSLDIKLGGCRDLSGLAGMDQIKYLELWQIKGLQDLDVVSSLRGLQFLFLQSLANVVRLPDFSDLSRLQRIHCQNMNALMDLSALSSARSLEELFFSTSRALPPEAYEWIAELENLTAATVSLGSAKRDERFRELAEGHGVGPYRFVPFEYVPG